MGHHRGSTGATPATSVPPQPLGLGSTHSGLHLAPGPRAWDGGWYTSRPSLSNNGRHSLARLSHPRYCPGSTGKLTSNLPRNKPDILVLQLQPEMQTRSGFTPGARHLTDLHRGTGATERKRKLNSSGRARKVETLWTNGRPSHRGPGKFQGFCACDSRASDSILNPISVLLFEAVLRALQCTHGLENLAYPGTVISHTSTCLVALK